MDVVEGVSGESGGDGNEGKNWVLSSDSVELSEDGLGISFRLDGTQLSGDHIKGVNDDGGLDLSLFEGLVVLSSLLSQGLLLLVKDD